MVNFFETHWVSIIGAVAGLIYLYLEYKASIWMWVAGIAMAGFYIFIFYSTHLYASMIIYSYFFVASIYGWIMWATKYQKQKETGDDLISYVPKRFLPHIIFSVILSSFFIYILLRALSTDQGLITAGDALTTALNIVALWMASHKWAEQWLLLVPANILSTLLLFTQDDITSSGLFLVFSIVSAFGYFKWKRMIIKN